MIRTDNKKLKTDRAWNRLYSRLNEEGLLPVSQNGTSARPFAAWKWRGAAAAILLLIGCSAFYFMERNALPAGDLLVRQNQEEATLVATLEDGSIIYLTKEASLHYPEHFAQEKREVSLTGDALFDVAGNRVRPFIIETDRVRVEVLGTAFNVKSDGRSPFCLSVKRGEVKVTSKQNGQNVHVKPGETVTLLSEKLQLSPTHDPEQFARYTRIIRFKDQRLADIVRVVNLREQKKCLQVASGLGTRKLTVTITDETPEEIAKLISLALNTSYTCLQGIYTLTEYEPKE